MSLGGRPCALGKKREIVPAVPLGWGKRLMHYGNDVFKLTPRQRRRFTQKKRAQNGGAA
jgi:hypothetical protein